MQQLDRCLRSLRRHGASAGRKFLTEIYGVPQEKIDLIPHGIPDMPFIDPNFYKDSFGVEGKTVLLTFGLLSPNKGIEYVIEAMPANPASNIPNVVYIVLGATHPNLVAREGETYRLQLERLAEALGVKDHVIFYNRFVDPGGTQGIHRRGGHLHHAVSE